MSFTLSLLLAVFGALLLVAVLLDDIAARLRVPGILLVLLLGLLTNNDVETLQNGPSRLLSLAQADQISQLALVLVLLAQGLTRQFLTITSPLPWGLTGVTWVEAALGLNLALAITSLSTTIFRSNQVNQCLIGVLAASALCHFPLPVKNPPETTSPGANPSLAGS